jgi:hypothetical protein
VSYEKSDHTVYGIATSISGVFLSGILLSKPIKKHLIAPILFKERDFSEFIKRKNRELSELETNKSKIEIEFNSLRK